MSRTTKNSFAAWVREHFSFAYQSRALAKDEICTWIDGEWLFNAPPIVGITQKEFKMIENPMTQIIADKQGEFVIKTNDGKKVKAPHGVVSERVIEDKRYFICEIPSVYEVWVNYAKINILGCLGNSENGNILKLFSVDNLGSDIYAGVNFVPNDVIMIHDGGQRNPTYAPKGVELKVPEPKQFAQRIAQLESMEKYAPFDPEEEKEAKRTETVSTWQRVQNENESLRHSIDELKSMVNSLMRPKRGKEKSYMIVKDGKFTQVTKAEADLVRLGSTNDTDFSDILKEDATFLEFKKRSGLDKGFPLPSKPNALKDTTNELKLEVKVTPLNVKRMKFGEEVEELEEEDD